MQEAYVRVVKIRPKWPQRKAIRIRIIINTHGFVGVESGSELCKISAC